MGRSSITDGTKKKQIYFLIEENKLKKIGMENLLVEFNKMVEKLVHNIDKGKVKNKIDLLQAISEMETTEKL